MNTRISKMLVSGYDRVAGLSVDGKVFCHGSFSSSDENYQCSSVRDNTGNQLIAQVFFGGDTSVTMDIYGNVEAAGTDDYDQVGPIADWKGSFRDVVCQMRHTVGLRTDGTVVACGWDDFDQCKVSAWHEIVAIDAGLFLTVGLKKDGTVVGCGGTDEGQTDFSPEKWKEIVCICCSDNHTVGLKKNGTVVACGSSEDGATEVDDWQNVVKVICGNHHTVGLKSDGTVVACGDKKYGEPGRPGICDVTQWSDVKDIFCCDSYTIGLKTDGTVLYTGADTNGTSAASQWRDIVHIACNEMAVFGIKRDGYVVTCGSGDFYSYEPVKKWRLFNSFETVDEDYATYLQKRTETDTKKSSSPASNSQTQAEKSALRVTHGFAYEGFIKECVCAVILTAFVLITVFLFSEHNTTKKALSPAEPDIQQTTEETGSYPLAYITASSGLNLRAGPGKDYDKITTLAYDTCVSVLETSGEWVCVRSGEYEGWCWGGYLRYE